MTNQTIEFVALTKLRTPFDNTEAFQFRKDRPAQWLQKVCFFVLRKLQAFYISDAVTIERHTLDAKTFMERLFKQKDGIERFFNRRPTKLLIGAEDYAELMQEVAATQMFSFHAEYVYGSGYGSEILGMTVQVIPWMRGCLVMPANVELTSGPA
jgi:hypothetical protein